jgi:hypothetical protein
VHELREHQRVQLSFRGGATVTVHVVRVRETQEYNVEVTTDGDSRDAARLARQKFLHMTVDEQATNSIGIVGRSLEAGEDEFDEDDLAV